MLTIYHMPGLDTATHIQTSTLELAVMNTPAIKRTCITVTAREIRSKRDARGI